MAFSEKYGRLRDGGSAAVARETAAGVPESVLQSVWFDQRLPDDGLTMDNGRSLRVVFPGWWNRSEGPDFTGAQLEMNGTLKTGDVEIHLEHGGWKQHGHDTDSRYDNVLLEVVFASTPAKTPAATSQGRRVPCLLLQNHLKEDLRDLAANLSMEDYPFNVCASHGLCAEVAQERGGEALRGLINLAGEWRLLCRARAQRERMERVGGDQALYESFLEACGFSRYKSHFRYVARQLPYERVRQLAREDPLLLEAAFLQIGGLLPKALPEAVKEKAHFKRLQKLRNDRLPGLRCLPLTWPRIGVRPNNYPARRLAGAARFLARTAQDGLGDTVAGIWRNEETPLKRRRAFEALFPRPVGFWANHCTWAGKKLARPVAPLGANRVRSIIGNVFVPYALGVARKEHNRRAEERILDFFVALPKEPDNRILKTMGPRIFGGLPHPRLTFRSQQGLIQMYQDWCHYNPTCRNCSAMSMLKP